MRTEMNESETRFNIIFDSLGDQLETLRANPEILADRSGAMRDRNFYGVSSMDEAIKLAEEGLPKEGLKAMEIANKHVETIEAMVDMPAFQSFYDVTGADVDVARYLSGEPESMINYNMAMTPRAGRVITVVNSINASCAVDTKAITRRGQDVAALVLAVEKIGFQVELWADWLSAGYGSWGDGGKEVRTRTRIKAPGELLDPGLLMYAYTHPSMLRALGFGAYHLMPKSWHDDMGVMGSYGRALTEVDTVEYPEGVLLVPPIDLYGDKSKDIVIDSLKELGIIE